MLSSTSLHIQTVDKTRWNPCIWVAFCRRENSQVPKPFIINPSIIITYSDKISSKIRENVRIEKTPGLCNTPIIPPKIQSITITHFALDIIHKPTNRIDILFSNKQQVSPPNGGPFQRLHRGLIKDYLKRISISKLQKILPNRFPIIEKHPLLFC